MHAGCVGPGSARPVLFAHGLPHDELAAPVCLVIAPAGHGKSDLAGQWLAMAGAAAIQQHLAITVQSYTRDLDTANTNAIAAQGLLPDIQLAASR